MLPQWSQYCVSVSSRRARRFGGMCVPFHLCQLSIQGASKWRQVCFTYPPNLWEMNLSQSLLKLNSLYKFSWRVLQALWNLWVKVIWEDPPNSLWMLYFLEFTYSSSTDPAGKNQNRYHYIGWWHWRAFFFSLGQTSPSIKVILNVHSFYRVLEAIKAWRLPCQPSYSLRYLNQAHLPCFWWLRTAAYSHSAWTLSTTIYIKEIIFTLMASSVKIPVYRGQLPFNFSNSQSLLPII